MQTKKKSKWGEGNRNIRERGLSPGKNFATSTSTGACPCKFSYNYYMYATCLKCKFCYKNLESTKQRTFSPHLLNVEKEYNKNLLTSPVIISKYVDPLYSQTVTEKSIEAMTYILENGGYVIFRSALHNVPDTIYNLAVKYKDHFQYQAKVFADNSDYGNILRGEFSKKFSDMDDMCRTFTKFTSLGIDSVLMIYPVIIGVNDRIITSIIAKFGTKKVIFHQLFATEKFKFDLSVFGHNISAMLSEKTREYYTYDNDILLSRMVDIFYYCFENGIEMSFCNNKTMNEVVSVRKNNCCQFEGDVKLFKDGK